MEKESSLSLLQNVLASSHFGSASGRNTPCFQKLEGFLGPPPPLPHPAPIPENKYYTSFVPPNYLHHEAMICAKS